MTDISRKIHFTGGCQCGAVRYAIYMDSPRIGLCHCRMCQKATAAPFGVFVDVPQADFAWMRGEPLRWQSSSRAFREFCGTCGTPLTFHPIDRPRIEILAGSLDHPEKAVPIFEVGRESKLAWLAGLPAMPGKTTLENMGAERLGRVVNYQHPDEDAGANGG
jgi:hypothetical protein